MSTRYFYVGFDPDMSESVVRQSSCWAVADDEVSAEREARRKLGGKMGRLNLLVEYERETYEGWMRNWREKLDVAGINWRALN